MIYNDNEHDDYDDNNIYVICNINAGAAGSGVESLWVVQRRYNLS